MALSAVTSILLTPLLLSVYGKAGLGSYWIILSVVSVLGMLEFGLLTASSKFLAMALGGEQGRLWESVDRLVKRFVLVMLGLLCVASAIVYQWLIGEAVGIDAIWREQAQYLFLLLAAALTLTLVVLPFAAKLQAFQQIEKLYFAQFLNAAFRLMLSLAVVLTAQPLWWLGMAAFMAALIAGIYQIRHALRLHAYPQNRQGEEVTWHQLLMVMLPLSVIMLGDILRFTLDSMIVGAFLGAGLVAVYGVGFLPADLLKQAMAPFSRFFMVWASSDAGKQNVEHRRLFEFARHAGVPIAILCGAAAATAPILIRFWMGEEFVAPASTVMTVLLLGLLFALPQTGVTGHLIGIGQQWPLAWLTLFEGIANLLLTLVLVGSWGLLGVAIGTCLPMIVSKGFVQPWLLARHSGLSYWHIWSALMRQPLLWGSGVYAVLVWPAWNSTSLWELAAYCGLMAVVAGVPVMRRILGVWRLRHG